MMSDEHIACRFDYTLVHSVVGWNCLNFMSGDLLPSLDIVGNVSYTLCLNTLCVSLCLGASVWAISRAYIRKYSRVFGILRTWGAFSLHVCSFYYCCHLQMPIQHVVPRSTSGLAVMLEILPPHPSDPFPRCSFSAGWRWVP
jgi:hypothetical protein